MNNIYTPGAVSSLIHLQTSSPEKSKEQKKLDRLFGKTKKTKTSTNNTASPAFVQQVKTSNNVSDNVAVTLKSSKKRLKKEIDVKSINTLSLTQKEEKLICEKNTSSSKRKKMGILTLKTKHKDRTNEEFKEISTDHKESKKRKIDEVSTTMTDLEGDDKSNARKKKKSSKKNNDTVGTEGDVSSSKRRTKINPPVINDVLCARKESDGSKPRTRNPKPDLSDLDSPDEDEEQLQQRRKKKKKRDKTNDYRTVFVGNLPLSITKKQLKKMFSPCGEIENLRLRGAIPANPNRGKKYAILQKAYHSKCKSITGYICFVNKESVSKACETMNSKEIEGQHIRVNPSIINKNTYDPKRSVFVGNLPFVISEDDVRKHFLDCGAIANIRLVKDWKTGIGKGIGYVKFEEADGAKLAVRLNDSKLNKRKIRVSSAEGDPKKRREEKVGKESEKAKIKKSKQKDFVGLKAEKMKKKKKDKPKHLARKMGLTKKKKDLVPKSVEKVTNGPNKHMVFE